MLTATGQLTAGALALVTPTSNGCSIGGVPSPRSSEEPPAKGRPLVVVPPVVPSVTPALDKREHLARPDSPVGRTAADETAELYPAADEAGEELIRDLIAVIHAYEHTARSHGLPPGPFVARCLVVNGWVNPL